MLIAHSYNVSLKKILKWVENIKEPPGRLEKVTFRKKNIQIYIDYAHTPEALKINLTQLRESFKNRVLGPEYPLVSKVKNYYIKSIMLKIEADKSFSEAKNIISFLLNHMKSNKMLAGCVVHLDVDPN